MRRHHVPEESPLSGYVPVEIKSRPRKSDLERYMALIVRGKMHLAVPGRYTPDNTMNAFAAIYEGTAGEEDHETINHVTSTMHDLLRLYQRGKRLASVSRAATRFHDATKVREVYQELSPDRALKKRPA